MSENGGRDVRGAAARARTEEGRAGGGCTVESQHSVVEQAVVKGEFFASLVLLSG